MKHARRFSGDLFVLAAMAIFGSYPLFLRLCPQISPLAFLAAFQLVGMGGFFLLALRRGLPRLTRRDYVLLAALAVTALLNDLCYFFAFTMTSVANAAVAHQSVSIFLLILAPLLLRERTRREEWISLVVSLLGILVLYSDQLGAEGDWLHLAGISLGVLSGLFYALVIVLYRLILDPERGLTVRVANFWRHAMSSALLIPVLFVKEIVKIRSEDLVSLVGFGLLFAVVASGIHSYGIGKTRSLHVSILGKSEPVFAILYAAFILNELPTPQVVVGGTLIAGSSLWLALKQEAYKAGKKEKDDRPSVESRSISKGR